MTKRNCPEPASASSQRITTADGTQACTRSPCTARTPCYGEGDSKTAHTPPNTRCIFGIWLRFLVICSKRSAQARISEPGRRRQGWKPEWGEPPQGVHAQARQSDGGTPGRPTHGISAESSPWPCPWPTRRSACPDSGSSASADLARPPREHRTPRP